MHSRVSMCSLQQACRAIELPMEIVLALGSCTVTRSQTATVQRQYGYRKEGTYMLRLQGQV
jgi:hypothetical protein